MNGAPYGAMVPCCIEVARSTAASDLLQLPWTLSPSPVAEFCGHDPWRVSLNANVREQWQSSGTWESWHLEWLKRHGPDCVLVAGQETDVWTFLVARLERAPRWCHNFAIWNSGIKAPGTPDSSYSSLAALTTEGLLHPRIDVGHASLVLGGKALQVLGRHQIAIPSI